MVDKIPSRTKPGAIRDIEQGWATSSVPSSRNNSYSRRANKLVASQLVRWRWMRRVLSTSLLEPFLIETVLKGTWLLNAWLRLMGADVSMGALILGRVADYKMAKVRYDRCFVRVGERAGDLLIDTRTKVVQNPTSVACRGTVQRTNGDKNFVGATLLLCFFL